VLKVGKVLAAWTAALLIGGLIVWFLAEMSKFDACLDRINYEEARLDECR
jgi:hypothetical protein